MLKVNFNPFPELSTSRLVLRKFSIVSDINDLFVLRSDSTIMRFIPRPLLKSPNDAEKLIKSFDDSIYANDAITWAITLKGVPGIIGTIGFVKIDKENYRAEIGYLLAPQHHGKGIMQEALAAVLSYGFEVMKLHSVEGLVHPDNTASASLLLRNKFTREASFKDYQFFDGKFLDTDVYSLLSPAI